METHRHLRSLTQAVCPPTCSGLQPTCLQPLEGQDSAVVLGDRSGLITVWGITGGGGAGEEGAVAPQLLLSGHDAEVAVLATAFPGNTGSPLVVSISADGMACAWAQAGASCLLRQRLPLAPTRGWVLLPDGHHLCFSCRSPDHARPRQQPAVPAATSPGAGGARSRAQQSRLLAVLEPLSLSLKGVLAPVGVQQLGLVAPGHDPEPAPGHLALKILALPSRTVALGVSTDAKLVTWDFSTLAGMPEGQPLTPPTSPPLSTRDTVQQQLATPGPALPGTLVGASFSEDASLLLLVCSGGWALLHAADWDGQGLPAYSHVLHMANSAEGGHAEAELAGGAILSGAMAADRARLDHYYAGSAAGSGSVETLVLWYADGSIAFSHVALGTSPLCIQPVAVVPPAASSSSSGSNSSSSDPGKRSLCSRVDVAFLGSSRFARLCTFSDPATPGDACAPGDPASGGAAGEQQPSPRLSIFHLPYLFPNMAAGGSSPGGQFPITLEPLAHASSLAGWGAAEAAGASGASAAAVRVEAGCGGAGGEPCVTVAALAGSNSHASEYLAQGMSDGSVQLWPLVAYAVPHLGSRSPTVELRGHGGMVTCLLELPSPHTADGGPGKLLLSASSDGSVCGWDLATYPAGAQLFSLHLHTDTVLQLVPPPPGQPFPWDSCLASIGADGAVTLLSLRTGCCERLLHAPPGCTPHTLAWDLGRGYLAAMCARRGGEGEWAWGAVAGEEGNSEAGAAALEQPVFVLWDVQAGSQDRVVAGPHAAAAMQTFLNGVSLHAAQQQAQQPQRSLPNSPRTSPPSAAALSSPTAGPGGGVTPAATTPVGGGGASHRPSIDGAEARSPWHSPFAPAHPYITASSIPHFSRGEAEGAGGDSCLLAHGVLLLDIDVHGLLHSREPLAGLGPPSPSPSARCARAAAAKQEKLPAIGALDLRSSSSRASLDRLRNESAASLGGRSASAPSLGLGMHHAPSADLLAASATQALGGGPAPQSPVQDWVQGSPRHPEQQQPQQQPQQQQHGGRATPDCQPLLSPAAVATTPTASARPPLPPLHSPAPLSPGGTTMLSPLGPSLLAASSPTPAMPPASLDAALLLALSLLHVWGLDWEADAAMLRMLCRCGVPLSPSAACGADAGCSVGAGCVQGAPGLGALDLVQPVWRDHDSFCMECPSRLPAPGPAAGRRDPAGAAGHTAPQFLRADSTGPAGAASAGGEMARLPSWEGSGVVRVQERGAEDRAAAAGASPRHGHALWCRDSRFVAERLLSLVALTKKLMGRHPLEEDILGPCSALATFYTLRLPELLPRLATPDVGLYAAHWQDSNDCIRDAARSLMAAATDPSLAPAGHLPPQLQAFEALWAASGGKPPPEQQLLEHSDQLLCCAAACLYHNKLVPERLVSITVPCLASLVFKAPSPLAAAAASLLAEGLASPAAAHHWQQHLGDLPAFLSRLYHLADQLAALSTELAHAPAGPAAHGRPHATRRHAPPGAPASPARIRPHAHRHARLPPAAGGGTHGAGPSTRAGVGVVHGAVAPGGSESGAGSVMACRDGVAALLSALASLDLRLFLQVLGRRLAGAAPPASPTHLLSFTALIRLMHSPRGQQLVATQLPLLVEVAMLALDPGRSALRKACMGGVMALVKELCMRYPMVAYHADSMQLAVAAPEARAPAPGLPEADSTNSLSSSSSHGGMVGEAVAWDPVAVYDLDTGHKTFQLRIDLPGSQHGGGADGGGWGLAAICFASHGDTLMGYCDGEGVALGWRLQRGWTHRLARGPAVLGPSKMVVVPAAAALRQMHQTPPGHVALGYSLKFETAGRLRLAHHDAVLAIDLDHA